MTGGTENRGNRAPLGLTPDAAYNLTPDEVRVLWSFIHGDIMNEITRQRLRASWGLCTRHAWGYAVTEIELWQSGAGQRGGHQPFDLSILYDDLLDTMRHSLEGSRPHARRRILAGHGSCVVCDDLAGPSLPGIAVTHAGFNSNALAVEANRMTYTREWIEQTESYWSTRVCPDCATPTGPDIGKSAWRCRRHLIETTTITNDTRDAVNAELDRVRQRLRILTDSMTQSGDPSTPEADASWVQALGWFHGWSFPLLLSNGY